MVFYKIIFNKWSGCEIGARLFPVRKQASFLTDLAEEIAL